MKNWLEGKKNSHPIDFGFKKGSIKQSYSAGFTDAFENNYNSFFIRKSYGYNAAFPYLIDFFKGRNEAKKYKKLVRR